MNAELILPPEEETVGFNGTQVLIAEDDKATKVLMSVNARIAGFKPDNILTAGNGREALDLIHKDEEEKIKLLVVDLGMPVLDGAEVVRRVQAIREDIEIIVISALDKNSIQQKQLNGVTIIQKPFNPKNLRDIIQGCLAA